MNRLFKRALLAAAAAFVVGAGTLATVGHSSSQNAAPAAPPLATVQVAYRDVERTYPAEGLVEAARQSVVAARAEGRIVELTVDAGDAVKKGQVIARIDERAAAQSVAESRAQVARAEADVANAKVNLERTQRLVAEKFVSAATLDKARTDYDAARAQLAAAQAASDRAVTSRDYTVITAPFAGLVAQRHVQAGDMALPGKPLVTIYDPAELRVVAQVPQAIAAQLRAKPVEAYAEIPTAHLMTRATRVTVLPSSDPHTLTTDVRLDLPASAGDIVPGTFARAHFPVGRAQRLVIPASAVVQRSELAGAYVLNDAGVVQLRQLRLGERTTDGIEVLAGLVPGDRVVIDSAAALARIKTTKP